MAGQPGFEFFGPWEDNETVLNAIMEAGAEFGIRRVGAKAYSASPLESGWVPTPFPAISRRSGRVPRVAAGRACRIDRRIAVLGRIHDYYMTPYDIGLGRSVRFDHDFHGRAALEKHAENQRRRKVTLLWNAEDVAAVVALADGTGNAREVPRLPEGPLRTFQMDEVIRTAGASDLDRRRLRRLRPALHVARDPRRRHRRRLRARNRVGRGPVSRKGGVDASHRQVRIRATVAPAPSTSLPARCTGHEERRREWNVVVTDIERADAAVVEALAGHGVATVHEAMGRTGLVGASLRPIQAGARIAGTAVTVLCWPGDNLMIHVAVEQCRPGDVLVVDHELALHRRAVRRAVRDRAGAPRGARAW